MKLVCQGCGKPIYKQYNFICFGCRPVNPNQEKNEPSKFEKKILKHPCFIPEMKKEKRKDDRFKPEPSAPGRPKPDPLPDDVVEKLRTHDFTIESVVRNHILKTLDFCQGSKVTTAKALGISQKCLYDKLERYGVHINQRNTEVRDEDFH